MKGKATKLGILAILLLLVYYVFYGQGQIGYGTNPFGFLINIFIPQQTVTGSNLVVAPNWIPIITLFLVIGILVFFVRWAVNSRRYPNDEEPVGEVEMILQSGNKVEGNISNYTKPLRPSVIKALKQNPKFAALGEVLEKLRESGKLWFYEMNYTDADEVISNMIMIGKPALIISTEDLNRPEICWKQPKAKFSMVRADYIHKKMVICHKSSHLVTVPTSDGDRDVWIIAPIPIVEEKQKKIVSRNVGKWNHEGLEIQLDETAMNVFVLPYSEELAKIGTSLLLASKQISTIADYLATIESQENELKERDRIINKLKRKNDVLRLVAIQKPIIGWLFPPAAYMKEDPLIWMFVAGFMAIFGTQLPTMFPNYLSTMNPLLGGFLMLILVAGIHLWMRRRNQDNELKNIDTEPDIPAT